jgi:hypothetical protein
MQTRAEHMAWCKKRALEYCERGDTMNALTSMFSDLDKHPETKDHAGVAIGLQLMMIDGLNSQADVRRFINGFN